MTILYRISAVLVILMLVMFGLNTSNQGINSLTMQTRQPVIGVQTQGNSVSIFTLGESHNYNKQSIASEIMQARSQLWICGQVTTDYMLRIAKVVKAFLLG